MRQTAEFIIGQFPDVSMTIESILAEGDEVAVRLTARGTNRGPIGGGPRPAGSSSRLSVTGSGLRTESSPSTGRCGTT
jgi:predicted ester cyclase